MLCDPGKGGTGRGFSLWNGSVADGSTAGAAKGRSLFYQYEGHVIWGLTAKLMRPLQMWSEIGKQDMKNTYKQVEKYAIKFCLVS